MVLAYEPVWAIGTGLTPSLDEAEDALSALRDHLARKYGDEAAGAIPILYGGSVNRGNASAIVTAAEVDGVLVGGASLDADGWASIVSSGPRSGTPSSIEAI